MNQASAVTFASPALDHIIERPRLIELIEEADARIVLLVAPAGYGKTTLAKQWCARQTCPVAWYRTTRASGDVGALAVGLDEVLAKATNPKGRDPGRIESIASVNPQPAPLARALLATYGELGADAVLVLDEWEASASSEADQLAAALLEGLRLRLIITSRSRPTWISSRLEVYGEVLELGLKDLAMTDREALEVLASGPSAESAPSIVGTARGWPAVIGLAAVAQGDIGSPGWAPAALYDFLATELLAHASSDVREAVSLIAISGATTVTAAVLLLGEPAHRLLTTAAAGGLLAFEEGGRISIHPLLRELISEELVKSSSSRRSGLAQRLRVLIAEGCWDEALCAAEALKNAGFVLDAIQTGYDAITRRGAPTVKRWLDAAAAAQCSAPLVDQLAAELSLRSSELDRALLLAQTAASRMEGDDAARAHLLAARAAYLGDRDEFCDTHTEAALASAASSATARAACWLQFARATEQERTDAVAAFAAFQAVCDESPDCQLRVATGHLHIGLIENDLVERIELASVASAVLEDCPDPMMTTSFLNLLSNCLAAVARYDEALAAAEREMAIALDYGLQFVECHAFVNFARAQIGLRQFARAKRSLSSLDRRIRAKGDPYFRAHHAIHLAGLYISMGDLERARAAVAAQPEATGRSFRGEYLATRALVLAALGETKGALSCADEANHLSRSTEVRALLATAHAVRLLKRDDPAGAETEVEHLVRSGAFNYLVLGVRACVDLATLFAADQQRRDVLAAVLRSSTDAAIARRVGLSIPRSILRSRALSARELEIHGLIAQGMTNPEIARLLYISESTTKVHVRHILEKLGVRSRVEATRVWQEENG